MQVEVWQLAAISVAKTDGKNESTIYLSIDNVIVATRTIPEAFIDEIEWAHYSSA
jgi:hypothetical protein